MNTELESESKSESESRSITKTCTKCNITKSIDRFSLEKRNNKYKYRTQCRDCRNADAAGRRDIKQADIQKAKNLLPKPPIPTEKQCIGCLVILPIIEFMSSGESNKINAKCRPCKNIYARERNKKTPKKHIIKEDLVDFQMCNNCFENKPIDTFLRHDTGTRRKECADCRKERGQINNARIKADPELNKEYNRKKQLAANTLLKKFPEKKVMRAARKKLYQAFKTGGEHSDLIGCDGDFFGAWFEFHFKIDTNLNYDNYGKLWHIDHVVPCAVFDITIQSQKEQCFHWSNIMPLLAEANIKKGAKINKDSINEQNKRLKDFCKEMEIDLIQISPPLSQEQPLHKIFKQKLTLSSRNLQDFSIAGTPLTKSTD